MITKEDILKLAQENLATSKRIEASLDHCIVMLTPKKEGMTPHDQEEEQLKS